MKPARGALPRRHFLRALGVLALSAPGTADAQPAGRTPHVAVLNPGSATEPPGVQREVGHERERGGALGPAVAHRVRRHRAQPLPRRAVALEPVARDRASDRGRDGEAGAVRPQGDRIHERRVHGAFRESILVWTSWSATPRIPAWKTASPS